MVLLPVAWQNAAVAALVVVRRCVVVPNRRAKTWALERGTAEHVRWCVVCDGVRRWHRGTLTPLGDAHAC